MLNKSLFVVYIVAQSLDGQYHVHDRFVVFWYFNCQNPHACGDNMGL